MDAKEYLNKEIERLNEKKKKMEEKRAEEAVINLLKAEKEQLRREIEPTLRERIRDKIRGINRI